MQVKMSVLVACVSCHTSCVTFLEVLPFGVYPSLRVPYLVAWVDPLGLCSSRGIFFPCNGLPLVGLPRCSHKNLHVQSIISLNVCVHVLT